MAQVSAVAAARFWALIAVAYRCPIARTAATAAGSPVSPDGPVVGRVAVGSEVGTDVGTVVGSVVGRSVGVSGEVGCAVSNGDGDEVAEPLSSSPPARNNATPPATSNSSRTIAATMMIGPALERFGDG